MFKLHFVFRSTFEITFLCSAYFMSHCIVHNFDLYTLIICVFHISSTKHKLTQMSHHLDNLLYFLENPEELSDGDNNDATEGCGGGGHLDETIEPPVEMETQLNETQSSTPRTRRSVVNLYRRSSSASQHILKNNHCYFCNLEPNQSNFENHLRGSQRCLSLYERKLKIKGIEGVLLMLFPCLFCCYNGTSRLQFHLERHPNCRDKYFQRWGVDIDAGADASQLNRGIRYLSKSAPFFSPYFDCLL